MSESHWSYFCFPVSTITATSESTSVIFLGSNQPQNIYVVAPKELLDGIDADVNGNQKDEPAELLGNSMCVHEPDSPSVVFLGHNHAQHVIDLVSPVSIPLPVDVQLPTVLHDGPAATPPHGEPCGQLVCFRGANVVHSNEEHLGEEGMNFGTKDNHRNGQCFRGAAGREVHNSVVVNNYYNINNYNTSNYNVHNTMGQIGCNHSTAGPVRTAQGRARYPGRQDRWCQECRSAIYL